MKETGMLWRRVIKAKFEIDEKDWYTITLSRLHGKGM